MNSYLCDQREYCDVFRFSSSPDFTPGILP
jgi:hypothetical protein